MEEAVPSTGAYKEGATFILDTSASEKKVLLFYNFFYFLFTSKWHQ